MMIAARHPGATGRLLIVEATPYAGASLGLRDPTPEAVRARADEIAAEIRSACPDARLRRAEVASHFVMLDGPQVMLAEIEAFISD